jgi:hypothetical protein
MGPGLITIGHSLSNGGDSFTKWPSPSHTRPNDTNGNTLRTFLQESQFWVAEYLSEWKMFWTEVGGKIKDVLCATQFTQR